MKDNYDVVYRGLLEKLAGIELAETVASLGGYQLENDLWIKFLGRPYRLSYQGIRDGEGKEPHVSIRIVLCHYLIRAGKGTLTEEWVSYRDFKDSAFFISNFQTNVEVPITEHFAGRTGELEDAAMKLGGRPYRGFQTGDVCFRVPSLPKVPLLLIFYDRDDDFPASCKLLFDKSAPNWLDMECLAVLGWILAELLVKNALS